MWKKLWCLIQKLDHNSGLHAKNQREISRNKVNGLLEGENAGTGGNGIRRGGNALFSPELGPDLLSMTLYTPHGSITKFLKNCSKNAGK